jgi:hypothetical protein
MILDVYYFIKNNWKTHGFEIVLATCVAFLVLNYFYNLLAGRKGTWSSTYFYRKTPYINKSTSTSSTRNRENGSKGENECRRVLETFFRRPFSKARPNFLNNPVTGGHFNLELDCFNEDLKLAVEYNGVQHYKFVPYFHKNHEAFLNQKYRDEIKRRMCKDNNIFLIEVPYTVSVDKISSYIKNELRKIRNNEIKNVV